MKFEVSSYPGKQYIIVRIEKDGTILIRKMNTYTDKRQLNNILKDVITEDNLPDSKYKIFSEIESMTNWSTIDKK